MAALHFLKIKHMKKLVCSAEMHVMPTDNPQNATPKKRIAVRALPGDCLIKEEKERPQVLKM